MKNPTQCVLWSKENMTVTDINFEIKKRFLNSDYLKRNLLKCRECGQLYFHEWCEHINLNHDAYMYETYIPVETEDEIQTLAQTASSAELRCFLPQLHGSFTNNISESLQWIKTDADLSTENKCEKAAECGH